MSGKPRGYKTGGRKVGTPNKKTAVRKERIAEALSVAASADILPLDVMRAKMNGETLPDGREVTDSMFAAAVAAAPYVHARLQATTLKGDKDAPLVHEIRDDSRDQIGAFFLEFASAAAAQRESGSDETKH